MAEGPAALIQLASAMGDEMQKKGMLSLYDEVELPLTGVLYDMERFCKFVRRNYG